MTKRAVLSWSGGKDACMTLHALVQQGYSVECLITTVPVETGRTFGHGEQVDVIKRQAEALSIPIYFIESTHGSYTPQFIAFLQELKKSVPIDAIAYGDLYLYEHREWGEKVAESVGIEALYPLWMSQEESQHALQRFVDTGYKAKVIRVRKDRLTDDWLGREVDQTFADDISHTGICPMGEAGEYHTLVYDGPLFAQQLKISFGEISDLEKTRRIEIADYELIDKKECR